MCPGDEGGRVRLHDRKRIPHSDLGIGDETARGFMRQSQSGSIVVVRRVCGSHCLEFPAAEDIGLELRSC